MSRPLPEDSEDIVFLRFKPGAKVHVLGDHRSPFDALPPDPEIDEKGEAWLDYLFAAQVSRCGIRGEAGVLYGVTSFDDEELCWRCYTSVSEGERPRLFERYD